jgi:cation diffusion facilitator family transporter
VVANSDSARVLAPHSAASARYGAVRKVLIQVLVLNVLVAIAKLVYGFATGTVSVLSDGFHSLTDGTSNIVALVGISIARKPPDQDHPYGHRKYETMATVVIVVFLVLVMFEVVQAALGRLRSVAPVEVTPVAFYVMCGTLAINLFVVWAEQRAGRRLSSEVLLADAQHTRSDVLTSLAVIGALIGTRAGYPILDPVAALVVAVFIGRAGYGIARDATGILSDRMVMAEQDIRDLVMTVPAVLGCHQIRSRGTADHVFLDLHVWLSGATRLDDAHAVSHQVKDRLMTKYPQVADAVIHIEPPPKASAPPV